MSQPLTTPLTRLLHIAHPILLAGMARTSSGRLAAAVTNAGGLGVIGGLGYTPDQLREIIRELKANLSKDLLEQDKGSGSGSGSLPFGVDLALPQVGGSARKTNHDYTHGQLDALIDVVIEERARLFVSAVGVPPAHVIDRLHAADILVMNMVGHPKHATKALAAGVDLVCAQGSEGGGHTGDIATSVLIPAVVAEAAHHRSPLTGSTPLVVAAGGIASGRSIAAMLALGASGVWVGTRFVAATEAGCSAQHQTSVVSAGIDSTTRTLAVSGRPLRVRPNEWVRGWDEKRPEEVRRLCQQGTVPLERDLDEGKEVDVPFLMGQVAGLVHQVKPAGEIVREMVQECVDVVGGLQTVVERSRL